MEKISFQNYQPPQSKKRTSERAELLKQFLEVLNAQRDLEKYKPLTPARLGMLLAPVTTKNLYVFLADCRFASHFSKYFWSRFKKQT